MPRWETIGSPPDLGRLEGAVDVASGAMGAVATALKLTATHLQLLGASRGIPNVLHAIVTDAVEALEQTTLGLLSNNVAVAHHLNAHWDPLWTYDRAGRTTPEGITDYVSDKKLPYRGTGCAGWLSDIAISSYDITDPMRPVTGPLTRVQGAIFVTGVRGDAIDLTPLKALLKVFPAQEHLRSILEFKSKLDSATESDMALLRLGPAFADDYLRAAVKPVLTEVVQAAGGTLVLSGTGGVNSASSNAFLDPSAGFLASVRVGDFLRIENTRTFYEIVEVLDDTLIRVTPTISGSNNSVAWDVRRGGIEVALSKIPADLKEFSADAGDLPMWTSVPLGAMVPGLSKAFTQMDKIVSILKPDPIGPSVRLGTILNEKAALIEQIISSVRSAMDIVDALAAFFGQSHVIVLTSDSGGMGGFINAALAADNFPDFGTRGVVIGSVVVTTADDPADHLENFFNLVGLNLSAYASSTTRRNQGLADTWNSSF